MTEPRRTSSLSSHFPLTTNPAPFPVPQRLSLSAIVLQLLAALLPLLVRFPPLLGAFATLDDAAEG